MSALFLFFESFATVTVIGEACGGHVVHLIYRHMQTTARVEDPTHLVLSEPLPMPRGSIVAGDVRESALVAEHADWIAASGALLEAAYGPDEPDYSECGERLS